MLVKFVLYNSKHALNRDLLSKFFAILHCEGSLRYSVRRPTALLFYTVKAFCGTRFEDRRLDGPAAIIYIVIFV